MVILISKECDFCQKLSLYNHCQPRSWFWSLMTRTKAWLVLFLTNNSVFFIYSYLKVFTFLCTYDTSSLCFITVIWILELALIQWSLSSCADNLIKGKVRPRTPKLWLDSVFLCFLEAKLMTDNICLKNN